MKIINQDKGPLLRSSRWPGSRNIWTAPDGGSSSGQPLQKEEVFQQAAFLRQAIADADWAMVARCGGLNVVMEKIDQLE